MPEQATKEAFEERDGQLGTAAALLFHRGETDIVELLVQVEAVDYVHQGGDWDYAEYAVHLRVDVALFDSLPDEVREKIRTALDDAAPPNDHITSVVAVPSPIRGDWRIKYKAALRTPRNQASLTKLPDLHPRADQMGFRDAAELRVYEGLKRAQKRLPEGETIAISVNPSVHIPPRTREPDFLVAYRGRVGMIEVDGASHRQKWSNDKSRDQLFEDAGIFCVRHIEAEFTDDARKVDEFIERFLRKLGER